MFAASISPALTLTDLGRQAAHTGLHQRLDAIRQVRAFQPGNGEPPSLLLSSQTSRGLGLAQTNSLTST